MAKKAYIGVNGISKNVKNIYVGVDGVPKKVVKGYVGVNGVPKVFWDGGGSSVTPSWDFWSSVIGNRNNYNIAMRNNDVTYKRNNKIAYFAVAILKDLSDGSIAPHPFYISPDADATAFARYSIIIGTQDFTSQANVVDSRNIVWYICYFPGRQDWRIDTIRPAGVVMNTESNPYIFDSTYDPETPSRSKKPMVEAIQEAALDLIDRIYSVPFHEDYQIGQEYRIPAYGDVRKTIRKIAGWQLAQNVSQYSTSTSYRTWSDNIGSTISTIIANINQHNNSSGMIIAQTISDTDYGEYELFVMHGHFQTGYLPPKINYLDRARILSSQQGQGNTHKLLEYYYDDLEGQYHWETYYVNAGLMEWQISAKVYSDEPTVIDFQDDDTALSSIWGNEAFIGTFNRENRIDRIDNVVITNIGIDL